MQVALVVGSILIEKRVPGVVPVAKYAGACVVCVLGSHRTEDDLYSVGPLVGNIRAGGDDVRCPLVVPLVESLVGPLVRMC
jgi:hypothetical protein